jgi:hypothetical protein
MQPGPENTYTTSHYITWRLSDMEMEANNNTNHIGEIIVQAIIIRLYC